MPPKARSLPSAHCEDGEPTLALALSKAHGPPRHLPAAVDDMRVRHLSA